MSNILLTEMEAYLCMLNFLDEIYKRTHSDDLGGFLGDMEINRFDSKPMDPAMWGDWIKAVQKVMQEKEV